MTAPRKKENLLGEVLAELLGTFVLLALGDGVVAMVVLFDKDGTGLAKGGYTNITLGWGLAVVMGICVAGRVSGAHLNPAVTLALAFYRDFPWRKVLPYVAAQLAGAFLGAALVYANYYPKFAEFSAPPGGDVELLKASIFTTFPAVPAAWGFALLDQFVGTALLVGLIFAIVDPRNQPVTVGMNAVMVGLVVVAIGISWGGMHGYAINPARDLGPRLFITLAGFKDTGFATNAWWVPIVGPLLGGLCGGLVYDKLVRPYLPPEGK
jgi:glycerol uptake facilitator protein